MQVVGGRRASHGSVWSHREELLATTLTGRLTGRAAAAAEMQPECAPRSARRRARLRCSCCWFAERRRTRYVGRSPQAGRRGDAGTLTATGVALDRPVGRLPYGCGT